jgi:hypothetical protein
MKRAIVIYFAVCTLGCHRILRSLRTSSWAKEGRAHVSRKNDRLGEDVGGRLQTLIDQLDQNIGLSADDFDFVRAVAEGVGREADLPNGVSHSDAHAVLTSLREAWTRGSRRTGAALIGAYKAEEANDLRKAAQILIATRDELAMPFYAEILDGELRRIESE